MSVRHNSPRITKSLTTLDDDAAVVGANVSPTREGASVGAKVEESTANGV